MAGWMSIKRTPELLGFDLVFPFQNLKEKGSGGNLPELTELREMVVIGGCVCGTKEF